MEKNIIIQSQNNCALRAREPVAPLVGYCNSQIFESCVANILIKDQDDVVVNISFHKTKKVQDLIA